MSFFNNFLGIVVWAAIVIAGIPLYFWLGNKFGKRIMAALWALSELMIDQRDSFWKSYNYSQKEKRNKFFRYF